MALVGKGFHWDKQIHTKANEQVSTAPDQIFDNVKKKNNKYKRIRINQMLLH